MALPVAGYLSSTSRTHGEQKVSLEDFLKGVKQIPGAGVAEATLTIASGAVTPPDTGPGIFSIDTEAAAATDDLTTITLTNLPNGSIILIRPANAARTITVKHNAGGSGQISLRTGGDLTLGDTTHWLMLKVTGTTLQEILRSPGEGVSGVLTKTGAYTTTDADRGKLIEATSGTFTITLLPVARAGVGFQQLLKNSGIGLVTVDGNASETIDGATTLKLQPGHEVELESDGTAWKSVSRYAPLVARGHLWGLTLANGTDAVNDIDIGVGECASDDANVQDRVLMNPGALTKRMDATWVAGTNQGGRTSSVALGDNTWHVFAMRVGGVDDYGFDTSVTGVNLAADHAATKLRRIGSVIRSGAGGILGFIHDGDEFTHKAPPLDVNAGNPGASAVTRTLTVPLGLFLKARMNVRVGGTAAQAAVFLSDLAIPDLAPSTSVSPLATISMHGTGIAIVQGGTSVRTNTSGGIRSRLSTSDVNTDLKIVTLGWVDTRGRY